MAINVARKATVAFSELDAKMARLWAIDQGITVPKRGRVSGETLLAWDDAGRPVYEVPVKFSVPRDEKRVFTAWCRAHGLSEDQDTYTAWAEQGKPEPDGYLSADTVAVIDYRSAQDGNVHQVAVLRDALREVRGLRGGRPAGRDYFRAAGLPDGAEPLRMVTVNGAVHSVVPATEDDSPEDQEFGFVIRWDSKRDGSDQLVAQVELLTAELTTARAEIERLTLALREAEKNAKPEPAKRAPRKPADKAAE